MTTNNIDDELKELQGRLACIKELLDEAYDDDPIEFGMSGLTQLYDEQGVNQAYRVASGGELPKRVKK